VQKNINGNEQPADNENNHERSDPSQHQSSAPSLHGPPTEGEQGRNRQRSLEHVPPHCRLERVPKCPTKRNQNRGNSFTPPADHKPEKHQAQSQKACLHSGRLRHDRGQTFRQHEKPVEKQQQNRKKPGGPAGDRHHARHDPSQPMLLLRLRGGSHHDRFAGDDSLDVILNLPGVLVPACGFLFQCVQHHFVEAHIHLHLFRRRRKPAQRQLPGKHLVKNHAEGIDVRAMIHFLRTLDLLRGHVMRRAHHIPGARQAQLVLVQTGNFCEPEIGDFHPATLIQHHVLWFDIPVNNAFFVSVLERLTDLRNNFQGLLRTEFAGFLQLAQIPAFDVFHQEIVECARNTEIMHGNDVGMGQFGQRARFAIEALGETNIVRRPWGQNLQCNHPVQRRLSGFIYRAHAAMAQDLDDFKLRKKRREFLDRWRHESGSACGVPGLRRAATGKTRFHQAFRAKALRGVGRQLSTARRTCSIGTHFVHPLLKKRQGDVTDHFLARTLNRCRISASTSASESSVPAISRRNSSR